jgi:hypothetical protein
MNKHNMEYRYNKISLTLKRKEILTHATAWIKPEHIMVNEISIHKKISTI